MKIAAIIAEYNPFHDGHRYHIEQTRLMTKADGVIAVMSGNFTQRGDLAVTDKRIRAEAALNGGVDLVIELPAAFALSSAEQFAYGAVALLNALNCVDVLSFGSESGNIDLLEEAAGAVHYAQTTDEFMSAVKSGMTYPAALQKAVEEYYTDDVSDVLTGPNNTLAVEYIKAINETGSRIKPFTVKRKGSVHDGAGSASEIRAKMIGGGGDFADIKLLETAILAKLRLMTERDIKKSPNVEGGLENRIFKAVRAARSLNELLFLAKTKRYTLARIRRAVLCCFLGITTGDVKLMPQYVRIIGMNGRGKEILAAAKCELPMDASLAALMKKGDNQKRQALLESRCSDIYALAFAKKRVCGTEFTAKPVIL